MVDVAMTRRKEDPDVLRIKRSKGLRTHAPKGAYLCLICGTTVQSATWAYVHTLDHKAQLQRVGRWVGGSSV